MDGRYLLLQYLHFLHPCRSIHGVSKKGKAKVCRFANCETVVGALPANLRNIPVAFVGQCPTYQSAIRGGDKKE
jgi:hypothetical protein